MSRRDRHHHHHHHYHKGDYAQHAGEPGPGPNRHRLRRDKSRKMIAGVCAGIAKYHGWSVEWLRIGWAASVLFMGPIPIFAYLLASFVIKPDRGEPRYASAEDERFWRDFTVRPRTTFSELKHRFRALDARIGDMEQAVTSSEYGLRKEFRDLERGV